VNGVEHPVLLNGQPHKPITLSVLVA